MSNGSPAVRAAIFVAVISAFLPTFAIAQPVIVMDRAFPIDEINPCVAGEVVTGTGRITVAAYVRPDPINGPHFTFRTITKGQATGVSGPFDSVKDYVFSSEKIEEQNTNGTSFEFTIVVNHVLVRKREAEGDLDPQLGMGTGEDFMMKQTLHLTVKDLIFVKAEVMEGHSRCM